MVTSRLMVVWLGEPHRKIAQQGLEPPLVLSAFAPVVRYGPEQLSGCRTGQGSRVPKVPQEDPLAATLDLGYLMMYLHIYTLLLYAIEVCSAM